MTVKTGKSLILLKGSTDSTATISAYHNTTTSYFCHVTMAVIPSALLNASINFAPVYFLYFVPV
jgi:hypothetical protein